MHRLVRLALPALLFLATASAAQDTAPPWNPRSGDAWVDAQLADINRYAARWPAPFADEIARYQGAPRGLVDELLHRDWTPGDIYFACALAQATGRPCRAVATEREQHRDEGWGALAQRLGVAPGSPAFHRLKRGFVPSYDRWGRPIHLDPALHVDFPDRAGDTPPAPPAHDGEGKHGGPPPTPHGHPHTPGKGHGHDHGHAE